MKLTIKQTNFLINLLKSIPISGQNYLEVLDTANMISEIITLLSEGDHNE